MPRIYYGWWLIGIAMVTYMLVVGTTYHVFQLFVAPASAEYHLSRAQMNTAIVFLSFGSAVAGPVVGRALDFISPKAVMVVGALLLGGSFAILGLTHSVPVSAAVFAGPMALASFAAAQLTLPVLLVRWFTAHRGRAMLLSIAGMSAGLIVVVPVVAELIGRFGWRHTLLIEAVGVTAILLLMASLIRERPGPGELEPGAAPGPDGAAQPIAPRLKLGAILGMPQFWTLTLGFALASVLQNGLIVSLAPLAMTHGLTMLQAAGLVSISGMAAVTAKLLLSLIADKVNRIYLLAAIFALGGLANGAILMSADHAVLIGCAACFGISSGAAAPVLFALLADRFGPASFGSVQGMLSPFSLATGAFGLRFAGQVYDRTGSYAQMHQVFVVVGLASAALVLCTLFTRKVA